MALDTRQKRQSATAFLLPCYTPGVDATGTINQAERQAASWVYSGIAAGEAIPFADVVRFANEAVALARFSDEVAALATFSDEVVALATFDAENVEN